MSPPGSKAGQTLTHVEGEARDKREQLITSHLSVVDAVAARYAGRVPPSVEYDDLYGAGVIGLIKAVDTWKPRKGPLECWCFLKVKGAIRDSLRGRNWREATHDELLEDRHDAADLRHLPEDRVAAREREDLAREVLCLLDEGGRYILRRRYGAAASLSAAGRDLGIGNSWVSKLHRNAIERAGRHFQMQGRIPL